MQEREPKRLATPEAEGWRDDEFSADLGHAGDLVDHGDASDETRQLAHHEPVSIELPREDRDRLVLLREGTQLRQGSTYLDLDDLGAGPFQAMGGQAVEPGQRFVPKHRTEFDLWNRLVGRDRE